MIPRLFHHVLEGKGNTGVTNRATLQQAILTVQGLEGVTGDIVLTPMANHKTRCCSFNSPKVSFSPPVLKHW